MRRPHVSRGGARCTRKRHLPSSSGPSWISNLACLPVLAPPTGVARRDPSYAYSTRSVSEYLRRRKAAHSTRGAERANVQICRRGSARRLRRTETLVCGTDITYSPAAASVVRSHFNTEVYAASTAKLVLAGQKTALNRQLPIFKLAFSARLRAGRLRSYAPVGANPPSALAARRGPPGPHPPSVARRRILDETLWHTGQQKA